MAMQRIANPSTSVRLRDPPPFKLDRLNGKAVIQTRKSVCPGGEIGRHKGFKIPRSKGRAGSSPAPGTISIDYGDVS